MNGKSKHKINKFLSVMKKFLIIVVSLCVVGAVVYFVMPKEAKTTCCPKTECVADSCCVKADSCVMADSCAHKAACTTPCAKADSCCAKVAE